ncbi:hypothetical protein IKX12_00840 [Candidatus Saccharibacteria bacterium]|nr:hypothetical protein [Candidatus Saccharibacteria bacterium]
MKVYVKDYYDPEGPFDTDLAETINDLERDCVLTLAVTGNAILEIEIDVIDSTDGEHLYSCRISNDERDNLAFDRGTRIEGMTAIGCDCIALPADFEYDLYYIDVTIKGKLREDESEIDDYDLDDIVDAIDEHISKKHFNGMARCTDS